jgi:hypothetical protein
MTPPQEKALLKAMVWFIEDRMHEKLERYRGNTEISTNVRHEHEVLMNELDGE